jgi:heme-degrading monooxygenase HmoA
MIKRIVKLTFDPNKIADFIEVFEDSKDKIKGFEGCHHLELLQDVTTPNIFFTFSYWLSEEHLHNYRHSELFISTWAKTKTLFCDKPQAWTVIEKKF